MISARFTDVTYSFSAFDIASACRLRYCFSMPRLAAAAFDIASACHVWPLPPSILLQHATVSNRNYIPLLPFPLGA
jgi:hypothetical protein